MTSHIPMKNLQLVLKYKLCIVMTGSGKFLLSFDIHLYMVAIIHSSVFFHM
jgi:hypothetical protein